METFPKITPVNLLFSAKVPNGDTVVVPFINLAAIFFNEAKQEITLRLSRNERICLEGYTPKNDGKIVEAMFAVAQRVYETGRAFPYDAHKHAISATISESRKPHRRIQVNYLGPCAGNNSTDFVNV